MKIPFILKPPPTPVKANIKMNVKNNKLIAEGSFYKVYKTKKNTVLKISKMKIEDDKEIEIMNKIRKHPFINRMKKWWKEGGILYFEMEECDEDLRRFTEHYYNCSNGNCDERDGDDRDGNSGNDRDGNSGNDRDGNSGNEGDGNSEDGLDPNGHGLDHNSGDGLDCNGDGLVPNGHGPDHNGDGLDHNSGVNHNEYTNNEYGNQINNTFITDPFSDSIMPCSTSIIITDDSSDRNEYDKYNDNKYNDKIANKYNDKKYNDSKVENQFNNRFLKSLMFQISSALSYIHSKGIIHMDVKPENILIKNSSNIKNIIFKLCDFNISKIGEGCFINDGDKIYMAPEILKNKCYFKSDVFSLGLIYLELMNLKKLPTQGEEYQRLRRNDFKGWKIDEIGRRMLEKNPMNRCSSKEVKEYFK